MFDEVITSLNGEIAMERPFFSKVSPAEGANSVPRTHMSKTTRVVRHYGVKNLNISFRILFRHDVGLTNNVDNAIRKAADQRYLEKIV